jgi:hypothetical protein
MAKATNSPAPTTPAPQGGLVVSARQAARIPVPKTNTPDPSPAPVVTPAPAPAAAAPPVTTPEPPKPPTDEERFAHLAKKEADLQKLRDAAKAEKAEVAAERAKLEAIAARYKDFETLKAQDPIQAMKLAGFSETDIFNYYAKAQETAKLKDTPEAKAAAAAKAEIDAFKVEQAKAAEVAKAQNDAAIIKRYQSQINRVVTADKDKYEFCNFNGAVAEAQIYETVEAYFKEKGEVLSPTEAADIVEKYYEDQAKAQMSLKKLGVKAPEPEPAQTPGTIPPARTLTNKVTATVASTAPKKETHQEKKDRLIAQIKEHGLRK